MAEDDSLHEIPSTRRCRISQCIKLQLINYSDNLLQVQQCQHCFLWKIISARKRHENMYKQEDKKVILMLNVLNIFHT